MYDSNESVAFSCALECRPQGRVERACLDTGCCPYSLLLRHHVQSKMCCRINCTSKVTFQDVTVDTIVVVVDAQPVLA